MNKIKPRTVVVNVHITDGDEIATEWNEKEQKMSIKVLRNNEQISAKKVELSTQYDRKSKPKVLNKIEFNKSSDFTVSTSDALKQYTHAWGIDTNKKDINGLNANVSGITVCSTDGNNDFYPVAALLFGETEGNAELFAWRRFITYIESTLPENFSGKLALIVDSEMSLIPIINERKAPIHGDFYLPSNWKLIYATSDAGKENVLNKILSCSDKKATEILNKISSKAISIDIENAFFPVDNEEKCNITMMQFERNLE